jgi:hypothetical protein
VRLAASMAGHLNRQLAGGIDPAGEHPGEGLPALLTRKEGLDDRGCPALVLSERVRATRHCHQHGRPPGLQNGLHQLRLVTGQIEVFGIAALAGCPIPE